MTAKLYLAHSEMRSINAKILAIVVAADGRPAVRLNQTIFHAQGGGQKADVGRIGDARVLHVTHNGGNVDHVVDSPELLTVGSIVRAELDHSWRSLNAAHHTAGHLVASVVERIFPSAKAVARSQSTMPRQYAAPTSTTGN